MSSVLASFPELNLSTALHLFLLFLVALLFSRLFKGVTNRIVQPASEQVRGSQAREEATRNLAGQIFSVGSTVIWIAALLIALSIIGINPLPAVVILGAIVVAVAIGAQSVIRDVVAGATIVSEDQFVVGDTIQVGEHTGRVEQFSFRRTVLRDSRGALTTIANSEIRAVANFSRDWSQTFVDISIAPEVALERPLGALENVAASLRSDSSWSPALLDGPRVLGLHAYDRNAAVLRIQIRTSPNRQEEVARELRRRIQAEFQLQGIPLSSVQRIELASAPVFSVESAGTFSAD